MTAGLTRVSVELHPFHDARLLRQLMNYINTFIAVSPDTKAKAGVAPPARGAKRSIAQIEYDLIAEHPYELTQLHFDGEGKVALVPRGSAEYRELSASRSIEQTRATRSKRA